MSISKDKLSNRTIHITLPLYKSYHYIVSSHTPSFCSVLTFKWCTFRKHILVPVVNLCVHIFPKYLNFRNDYMFFIVRFFIVQEETLKVKIINLNHISFYYLYLSKSVLFVHLNQINVCVQHMQAI